MNKVHCCRFHVLFSSLTSFLLVLLVSGAASGVVSLPVNYEADLAWPLSPWYAIEVVNPLVNVQPSNGILTLDKDWGGEPHVLYSVNPLDFTSDDGVTIEARLKLGEDNSSPIWISVTDENNYFAYFHIYPDRIQRHQQNNLNPLQTRWEDFTQWREITIAFRSQHMLLFLDGELIMDSYITGKYIGGYPSCVIFGIPSGIQLYPNNGPSLVQLDYLRIRGLLTVIVDIKPGSCPNPLNVKDKGVLPVAILGSEDFDVFNIDPASIRLESVAPIRSNWEDVAAPAPDTGDVCECTTKGPDGYIDFTLKFDTQEIVEELGELNDGDVLPLILTGVDIDGTPIEGSDCVVIIQKGKKEK
jgi:hypothetical protein